MKKRTTDMVLISLFAALTAVGAFVRIPIPPVPLTLQTLMVMFSGMILGSRRAALSQLLYMIVGLIGVPIFAQGGGPGYVFQPSFGFLVGFIAGAWVIGRIVEGEKRVSLPRTIGALLWGQAVIYLIGIPYLYFILNFVVHKPMSLTTTLKIGFLIFIPGDVLKIAIACLVITPIRQRISIFQHN
jgi:biotin transport system substrate-specific component